MHRSHFKAVIIGWWEIRYQDTYPLDIHAPDIHPLPFTP